MPYAFTTETVEYIRHGSTLYMMKLYKPSGDGPFPMVIDLHGGAWCNGDLADCDARDQVLAASGLVVAAANFRHADEGYPTSLADINFAIRWMKTNAAKVNGWRERGWLVGHQQRRASRDADRDAPQRPTLHGDRVACRRFDGYGCRQRSRCNGRRSVRSRAGRNARRLLTVRIRQPGLAAFRNGTKTYWKTEAAMIEGNLIGS